MQNRRGKGVPPVRCDCLTTGRGGGAQSGRERPDPSPGGVPGAAPAGLRGAAVRGAGAVGAHKPGTLPWSALAPATRLRRGARRASRRRAACSRRCRTRQSRRHRGAGPRRRYGGARPPWGRRDGDGDPRRSRRGAGRRTHATTPTAPAECRGRRRPSCRGARPRPTPYGKARMMKTAISARVTPRSGQ